MKLIVLSEDLRFHRQITEHIKDVELCLVESLQEFFNLNLQRKAVHCVILIDLALHYRDNILRRILSYIRYNFLNPFVIGIGSKKFDNFLADQFDTIASNITTVEWLKRVQFYLNIFSKGYVTTRMSKPFLTPKGTHKKIVSGKVWNSATLIRRGNT